MLAAMTHHIQMVYRDSTTGQNHKDWVEPIAGIGQGNGGSSFLGSSEHCPIQHYERGQDVCHHSERDSHHKLDLSGFAFLLMTLT